MKRKTRFENKRQLLVYSLIAVFYLWMAAQIPYTHDDWDWGLDIGLQQLIHATVNSRYAGNFFVVIMTRSELVKTLIMGAGYFLIPFLLSRLASKFDPNATASAKLNLFLICNCLLLTMNREMFRETYGWVSGYANFVISALFMVPWIQQIFNVFDKSNPGKTSVVRCIALFLLAICSQLFIENLAIFHMILACALCFTHYARKRKVPAETILMLIGAAVGLLIMFSSNLYDSLISTGYAIGEYRQIPILSGNGIGNAIRELVISAIHLSNRLYSRNITLAVFILVVLSALLSVRPLKHGWRNVFLVVNILLCTLLMLGFIYDVCAENHLTLMYLYDCVLSVCYFVIVALEIIHLFCNQKSTLFTLLYIHIATPIIIAPLLITTEVGSRLFFNSNIYFMLLGLILASECIKFIPAARSRKTAAVVSLCAAILFAFHGFIYAQIGACKHERDKIIREAQTTACTEITLPGYPFHEYLHFSNPSDDYRIKYFTEFFGIPENIAVIFE